MNPDDYSFKEYDVHESRFDLSMRRKDFLHYTIKFYNLNNRAFTPATGCTYYPIKDKNGNCISPGCAIGQHITDELNNATTRIFGTYHNLLVSHERGFINLPEWLTSLGTIFLAMVQNLHDSSNYWNEDGLNNDGWVYHNAIQDYINFDNYDPLSIQ